MRNKYTRELIEPIVKESKTWGEVCRTLGVSPSTGAQTYVQKRAKDFSIDSSHFLGQAHNRGRIFEKKSALEYCYDGSTIQSHTLKLRLIRDGHKEAKCEMCGLTHWHGDELPLELDHINSNHFDNRIENLQILCPNCHAVETRKRRGTVGMVDILALDTSANKVASEFESLVPY